MALLIPPNMKEHLNLPVPLGVIGLVLLSLSPAAGEGLSRSALSAADFASANSATAGIQEAIDALPSEGGTVFIPAGEYPIIRPIELRSNVRLRGEDRATVIHRRDAVVRAALVKPGKAGDLKVVVADTSGFRPGGEVLINAERMKGWKSTHAIVSAIDGKEITLDRALINDYALETQAQISNLFPAIHAKNARNVVVERLSIDGRWDDPEDLRVDFTANGIHFDTVRDAVVERVHVQRYPADGIGIQRGENVSVIRCIAERNLGHGFHPGSKLTSGSWTDNVGRYNGWDGFFFCQNVRYLNVSGNRFHHNGGHGIGNLGYGGEGDRYNVVTANFCYSNGLSGIEVVSGGNNVVSNNVCENNSRSEPGRWPGILVEDTHSTVVAGNRCIDSQPEGGKTQAYGIIIKRKSTDNVVTGNMMTGHTAGGIGGDSLAENIIKDNIAVAAHRTNQP